MGITLEVELSDRELNKVISKAMMAEAEAFLVKIANNIRPKLKDIIRRNILETPEIRSLIGGKLQAELGLTDPRQAIDEILNVWQDTVRIDIRPLRLLNTGMFSGGIDIYAIRADFADVLSTNSSFYIAEKSGTTINWLEWLLLEGDKSIVIGYDIGYSRGASRTGLGKIMKKSKRNWRVPPEYAGTVNNNFVTKTLDNIETELNAALIAELSK